MHELGIVVHISRTLQQVAEENQVSKIGSVTLEVGEVSGIVHDYITDCWNYYRKRIPLLEEAELVIETMPAVTRCDSCEQNYETINYGRTCPYCGSEETWLVKGNECSIREIEAG